MFKTCAVIRRSPCLTKGIFCWQLRSFEFSWRQATCKEKETPAESKTNTRSDREDNGWSMSSVSWGSLVPGADKREPRQTYRWNIPQKTALKINYEKMQMSLKRNLFKNESKQQSFFFLGVISKMVHKTKCNQSVRRKKVFNKQHETHHVFKKVKFHTCWQ